MPDEPRCCWLTAPTTMPIGPGPIRGAAVDLPVHLPKRPYRLPDGQRWSQPARSGGEGKGNCLEWPTSFMKGPIDHAPPMGQPCLPQPDYDEGDDQRQKIPEFRVQGPTSLYPTPQQFTTYLPLSGSSLRRSLLQWASRVRVCPIER